MADKYDSYSNDYVVPIDSVQWKPSRRADVDSLLKGFWASVKSELGHRKIAKCYMTGVVPQYLADNTSGFNVARNISWEPELVGFCGLTEADVAAALTLKNVCESTAEAERHLKTMRDHYNGFNFVPGGQGPSAYNTNTCLEYLQNLAMREPMEDPLSVTNSEASEVSLLLLAASSMATQLLEDRLFSGSEQGKNVEDRVISYDRIGRVFTLESLAGELARSKAPWLSYMDVDGAFRLLTEDGYIDRIIGLYARDMQQYDVAVYDFKRRKRITPSGTPGRIDMLVSVPLRKWLFVLEWRAIKIDCIQIGSGIRLETANVLAEVPDASEVLDLKLSGYKFGAGQTVKEWILDGPKVSKKRSATASGVRAESRDRELDLATFPCGILMAISSTRLRDSPSFDVAA
ncbi:hypothetical protein BGX30_015080 [Mortierella sp. GBA39]|nr:hypothetical protein BGX30_015080 [Mortierella sp. GBA39]